MNRFFILAAAWAFSCTVAVGDRLEPTAGPPAEGFFLSYDKGKFNFMNREQKTLHISPTGVKKIMIDKPLVATLELKSKRNEKSGVSLKGFEAGSFLIERDGKDEKVPVLFVAELRVDATANNRTMDQLDAQEEVISKGEQVELKEHVEQGKVTIVHFHLPGSISSERQGNYVDTLARDGKGKVVLRRAIVKSAGEPVARQYGLTTLPQFWFYGKNGQLVTKLTDRFTENDIAEALKKASRP